LLAGLEHLVIMGGALNVPGNLNDGGLLKTYNKTAEWNIFVDPAAASIVFTSVARMTLIPLDATVKVPIDSAFLKEFRMHARTPLGKFAGEVLDSNRNAIESGYFQAWDPLAAVALVQPAVVATKPMKITVLQARPAEGRTVGAESSNANVAVALDANASEFKRTFFSAF
jgi:pyrimidine-specific ribonucleoside hydrolase